MVVWRSRDGRSCLSGKIDWTGWVNPAETLLAGDQPNIELVTYNGWIHDRK
ncbi:hypothetical protein RB1501 [Rhodopirellula baltica SH 1]|uniref:Uncharacterized protein n=1 Tax=Rhodopirellula baltica (strain DSM 10527 / NCIMB 13988 / SH1) TaxID=243090 RepID=Q7UX82_RHOBA|nr:hypothetical protein RB1501 [Rhodopirellula baltica SH 1]